MGVKKEKANPVLFDSFVSVVFLFNCINACGDRLTSTYKCQNRILSKMVHSYFQSYLLVKALPNLLVKSCFWCRIFTLFLTEESAKFPLVLGKLNRTWITCFKYKEGIFFF